MSYQTLLRGGTVQARAAAALAPAPPSPLNFPHLPRISSDIQLGPTFSGAVVFAERSEPALAARSLRQSSGTQAEFVPSTRANDTKGQIHGRHSRASVRASSSARPFQQEPQAAETSQAGGAPMSARMHAVAAAAIAARSPVVGATSASEQDRVQQLVSRNTPLVFWLAKKFGNSGLAQQDLVGEGLLALQRAASSFNPSQGAQFSTYAWALVSRRMQRAAQEYGRPLRVPPAKWALMQQERVARQELEGRLQRPPTLEEVATALATPPAQLRALRRLQQASFRASDAVLSSCGGGASSRGSSRGGAAAQLGMSDMVGDESEGDLSCLALEATVGELLGYLPPQQRQAVELRYGLAGDREERGLREVAEGLQVSKSAARSLLSKALGTLRVLAQ